MSSVAFRFLFILSIFGHVSRWMNRRVCFLVLMVLVFASAIVLLVILGLSVGLFSSFVPSLKAPQNPQFLRSANPEQEDGFEQIKEQIRQSRKSDSNNGQSLAYENLKKVLFVIRIKPVYQSALLTQIILVHNHLHAQHWLPLTTADSDRNRLYNFILRKDNAKSE